MEQQLNNTKSSSTAACNVHSASGSLGSITRNLLILSVLCAWTAPSTISAAERCEIVFTDSQAAVLHASALTGDPGVITSKNKLVQPFGIAVGQGGMLYVSDTGCLGLVRINPATQTQTVLACGGALGVPFGIAMERSGTLLVANAEALLRVDPQTGVSSVVSTPGLAQSLFRYPLAVTVADNGDI